jgi:hypothetical protein
LWNVDVTNSRIIRNTGKDTAGDDRTKKGAKEEAGSGEARTPIRILCLITTGILILRKKLSLIHSQSPSWKAAETDLDEDPDRWDGDDTMMMKDLSAVIVVPKEG